MVQNDEPPIINKRVSALEAGMTLARSVHAPNGCRLLPAGRTLDQDDIQRLRRHNRHRVHVYDPDEQGEPGEHDEGD